jgi:hypothetical protein
MLKKCATPENRFSRCLTRRTWLQRCGVSSLGWAVWNRIAIAQTESQRILPVDLKPLRSCIFVFCYGGPSHLDTFDMKPSAPQEIRGEFQPISSSAPGLAVCEHLPHMSQIMHKVTLVRSMHHTNRLHDSASIETFTGQQGPQGDREEFAAIPQFFPCHGAVLNYLQQQQRHDVSHAVLPWLFHNVIDVPCQGGGFLGSAFDPFRIDGDLANSTFSAKMLERPQDLTLDRIALRRQLLRQIDETTVSSRSPALELSSFYEQAYGLLTSVSLQKALQIDTENDNTRERYGLYDNQADPGGKAAALAQGSNLRGQSLLQARRLVEAGIPFVNVNDFRQQGQNWDSHADNFGQNKNYLLPPIDKALSALIEDLDDRGLLDTTLVVALGEFGRTPNINGRVGRDHWPDCYTILLAGGGIDGGTVLGASDAHGRYPDRDPVTPADLAATIYWRFGLDPHTMIHDATGRPYRLSDGRPLVGLFG